MKAVHPDDAYDEGYGAGLEAGYDEARRYSPTRLVTEFHERFGEPIDAGPSLALREHRADLIDEESMEAYTELLEGDPFKIAKELADLVYVTYGTAIALGIDLDRALEIVHQSNMSKAQPDGIIRRSETGKVLKPEGYVAPDMTPAVPSAVRPEAGR